MKRIKKVIRQRETTFSAGFSLLSLLFGILCIAWMSCSGRTQSPASHTISAKAAAETGNAQINHSLSTADFLPLGKSHCVTIEPNDTLYYYISWAEQPDVAVACTQPDAVSPILYTESGEKLTNGFQKTASGFSLSPQRNSARRLFLSVTNRSYQTIRVTIHVTTQEDRPAKENSPTEKPKETITPKPDKTKADKTAAAKPKKKTKQKQASPMPKKTAATPRSAKTANPKRHRSFDYSSPRPAKSSSPKRNRSFDYSSPRPAKSSSPGRKRSFDYSSPRPAKSSSPKRSRSFDYSSPRPAKSSSPKRNRSFDYSSPPGRNRSSAQTFFRKEVFLLHPNCTYDLSFLTEQTAPKSSSLLWISADEKTAAITDGKLNTLSSGITLIYARHKKTKQTDLCLIRILP